MVGKSTVGNKSSSFPEKGLFTMIDSLKQGLVKNGKVVLKGRTLDPKLTFS